MHHVIQLPSSGVHGRHMLPRADQYRTLRVAQIFEFLNPDVAAAQHGLPQNQGFHFSGSSGFVYEVRKTTADIAVKHSPLPSHGAPQYHCEASASKAPACILEHISAEPKQGLTPSSHALVRSVTAVYNTCRRRPYTQQWSTAGKR